MFNCCVGCIESCVDVLYVIRCLVIEKFDLIYDDKYFGNFKDVLWEVLESIYGNGYFWVVFKVMFFNYV